MGTLAALLERAERVLIFTGAGISTESGIPDFRSPNGVWSKTNPVYFDEFVSSESARREAWRQKLALEREMSVAKPNRGHRAVEKLVRIGKVTHVITQNIDGLHQSSGIPDENIMLFAGHAAPDFDSTQCHGLQFRRADHS